MKPTPNGHGGDAGNRRYLVLREATMPVAVGKIHRSGGHPGRLYPRVQPCFNTLRDDLIRSRFRPVLDVKRVSEPSDELVRIRGFEVDVEFIREASVRPTERRPTHVGFSAHLTERASVAIAAERSIYGARSHHFD